MKTGHWKSCKLLKCQHESEVWQTAGGLKWLYLYLLLDSSGTSAPGLLSQPTGKQCYVTAGHRDAWAALAHLWKPCPYASMPLETQKSFLITLKPCPAEAGQSCQGAVQILLLIWAGAKQMGAHLCHCKWAAFLSPSHFMAGLIAWRSLVCWPCCCAASPAAPWQRKGLWTVQKAEPWKPAMGHKGTMADTVRKHPSFPYVLSHPGKRFGLHCVKIYTQ